MVMHNHNIQQVRPPGYTASGLLGVAGAPLLVVGLVVASNGNPVLGALLVLAGAGMIAGCVVWRRKVWSAVRQRITKPRDPAAVALLIGGIVASTALAVLVGWGLEVRGGFVLVLAAPLLATWYQRRRTAFVAGSNGARIGSRQYRWGSVTTLVVSAEGSDARLTLWSSEGEPSDVVVEGSKLDLGALDAHLKQFAPSVKLVVEH